MPAEVACAVPRTPALLQLSTVVSQKLITPGVTGALFAEVVAVRVTRLPEITVVTGLAARGDRERNSSGSSGGVCGQPSGDEQKGTERQRERKPDEAETSSPFGREEGGLKAQRAKEVNRC